MLPGRYMVLLAVHYDEVARRLPIRKLHIYTH